ncbi:hypothetical protein VSDG_06546 [Cytospora chrysosperma]|uniref:Uncharacterized protein n=1 Tax=Cytospora chrysosperma TaxID=252740 RepID=A0A423VP70_CYTCH|nr:hypothetical protein VSDG_06546 [Valsa sordida]
MVWMIAIADAIEASIAMGTTQPLDEERCLAECPGFVSDQCHFEQGQPFHVESQRLQAASGSIARFPCHTEACPDPSIWYAPAIERSSVMGEICKRTTISIFSLISPNPELRNAQDSKLWDTSSMVCELLE